MECISKFYLPLSDDGTIQIIKNRWRYGTGIGLFKGWGADKSPKVSSQSDGVTKLTVGVGVREDCTKCLKRVSNEKKGGEILKRWNVK